MFPVLWVGVSVLYLKMLRLSVFRCRLSLMLLSVTRRHFVPVAALYKTHTACHCHSSMFDRRLSTGSDEENYRTAISFPACSLLFAAVFIPALGIVFYYRKERRKLLKKYEGENVYQTPFVDAKTRLLVQHKGIWFPVVMFPSLQRFEQIRHFTLKDDDVLINSFPKSGSICLFYYNCIRNLNHHIQQPGEHS